MCAGVLGDAEIPPTRFDVRLDHSAVAVNNLQRRVAVRIEAGHEAQRLAGGKVSLEYEDFLEDHLTVLLDAQAVHLAR